MIIAQPARSSAVPMEFGALCWNHFSVGGVSVSLAGEDESAVTLGAPLAPFQANFDAADIDLRVQWVDDLPAFTDAPCFDSGALWRLYDGHDFRFDFRAPVFGSAPYKRLIIDKQFAIGTLEVSRKASAQVPGTAPLDYPLDELLIMHRLTQERAIEFHGSGIVRADGIGNLFVGHSGAGKSTTTRLWTERENVEVLSDDRIIVRRDDSCAPHGLRMYGTPWHGEAHYASPGSAPLARIFVLEHCVGNILTQLSPGAAVAELFARSFVPFHCHEYVESALSFLHDLVSRIPVYRFSFQPDSRAVETILHLHD